ncbi:MAG: DUF6290 family protein [Candidatus Omnitrophota bacterium]
MNVQLPMELKKRLNDLKKKTGRAKSDFIRQALEGWLEEEEDYRIASERFNKKNQSIPFEQLESEIDLED